MTCMNCGTRHSSKYCPECGAMSEAITTCTMCGHPHTNKFCPECGTAAASLPAQAPQAAVPQAMHPAMPQEAPPDYYHQLPPQETAVQGPVYTAMSPTRPMQPAVPKQQPFPAAQPQPPAAPAPFAQANLAQATPTIIINNSNENYGLPATAAAAAAASPYAPSTTPSGYPLAASHKSKFCALMLCIFLGWSGVHYFYVGKVLKGLIYLFTFGLLGFGWLFDIARIAGGNFRDSWGYPLVL